MYAHNKMGIKSLTRHFTGKVGYGKKRLKVHQLFYYLLPSG
jgi:hypothetical protein